jgi:hypothetical protein
VNGNLLDGSAAPARFEVRAELASQQRFCLK